jgi:CPA2 family monovalent cation:H+ antiporter-2
VIEESSGETIARLGPGDYFGEMALLSDSRRNASVRTLSEVEVATLGKENFLSMVKLLPAAEEAVLSTVQDRAMRAGGSPR